LNAVSIFSVSRSQLSWRHFTQGIIQQRDRTQTRNSRRDYLLGLPTHTLGTEFVMILNLW